MENQIATKKKDPILSRVIHLANDENARIKGYPQNNANEDFNTTIHKLQKSFDNLEALESSNYTLDQKSTLYNFYRRNIVRYRTRLSAHLQSFKEIADHIQNKSQLQNIS